MAPLKDVEDPVWNDYARCPAGQSTSSLSIGLFSLFIHGLEFLLEIANESSKEQRVGIFIGTTSAARTARKET
jgi:hypothetical protein